MNEAMHKYSKKSTCKHDNIKRFVSAGYVGLLVKVIQAREGVVNGPYSHPYATEQIDTKE